MTERVIRGAERLLAAQAFKKNLEWFSARPSLEEFRNAKKYGGSAGQVAWLLQAIHRRAGLQMQVSKEVSADLIATDFGKNADIGNVPFPAPAVEMYFEDERLPTLLLAKYTPESAAEFLPKFVSFDQGIEGEHIAAMMRSQIAQVSILLHQDMYRQFLSTGEINSVDDSFSLDEDENLLFCYMLHLAFKVMIFSSLPYFKPRSMSRKDMKHGGKPNVKGRPERESLYVAYLPHVEYQRGNRTPRFTKKHSHTFRGRRGHIRWFHDSFYVKKQGTWSYVRPVKDPETGKFPVRVVKVRLPPEGAVPL